MTGMKFNHESKPKYTVTVTAEDSFGATDSIRVDIYVVDVDEAPEGTGTTMAANTIEYTEDRTDAVLTLSAGDPEGATPITWSLPADGDDPDEADGPLAIADAQDNGVFKINQDGVLEFRSSPNHEIPADDGRRQHLQRSGAGHRRRRGPPDRYRQPVGDGYARLVQGDRQRLRTWRSRGR